ncbi:hypothetical protein ACUJ46_10295 [Sandaracinobacteroides sp. A072]|uniref:hypothetical protein n=1 Tax=Sandaracinobacteroides sp. A072 TaxID=3461146 RepID=UPI004042ED7B
MILLSALVVAALGLGEIPPQKMASGRCVTFLWTRSEPQIRIAMVDESVGVLRMRRNGRVIDLRQTAPTRYAGHGLNVTVSVDYEQREGLSAGAVVESGALRVEAEGRDAIVVPVGGMRACQ